MGLLWLAMGVIITICIFLFVPGLFDYLVTGVQWFIHMVSGFLPTSLMMLW